MDFVVQLIEQGDVCSLLALVLALICLGSYVSGSDPWAQLWGQRLAVLALIAYCGYGVVTVAEPDAADLLRVALRGVLAAGLVLGVAWILLGATTFLRAHYVRVSSAAKSRAAQRRSEREQEKQEKEGAERRRREQEEWERTAPERDRRRIQEEARQREEKLCRQNVLAACESLFMLYAPEIRDRFSREQFDDFVAKFLDASETPEVIESRGRQLEQLIRDHHQKVNPPEKFHNLEELATWYAGQKQQIEGLVIDDSIKRDYLVQLNERYAELTQQVMENLAP